MLRERTVGKTANERVRDVIYLLDGFTSPSTGYYNNDYKTFFVFTLQYIWLMRLDSILEITK